MLCSAILAGLLVFAAGGPASAQGRGSIACGGFYVVSRGDTLHDISVRAYGTANYQKIFEANRSILKSVAVIEVGDRLLIPCLDGTGFQTREAALPAGTAGAVPAPDALPDAAPGAEAVATAPAAARILVLAERPPFTGRGLPEGGMIGEIIGRSILRVRGSAAYAIEYAPRETPLEQVPALGYDAAYPAVQPDCERLAILPEARQRLCTGFVWSEPVAEYDTRFYVARGNELVAASDPGQLFGLRLCRPAGSVLSDLEVEGLVEPNVTLVQPASADDCLRQLARGSVDAASVSGPAAERAIEALGVGGAVAEIELFRRSTGLRVAAPAGNAAGAAFVEDLDQGVAELRGSGEFQAVAESYEARP